MKKYFLLTALLIVFVLFVSLACSVTYGGELTPNPPANGDCGEYPCVCGGESNDCGEYPCICDEESNDCGEYPCVCEEESNDCGEDPCICDGESNDCGEYPCICDEESNDCGEDPCVCEEENKNDCGEYPCICDECALPNQPYLVFIEIYGYYGWAVGLSGNPIPNDGIIRIPSYRFDTGLPVRAILPQGFYSNPFIKEVKLPDGLTGIGNSAFQGSIGIRHIFIPHSVYYIHEFAFGGWTGNQTIHFRGQAEGVFILETGANLCFDCECDKFGKPLAINLHKFSIFFCIYERREQLLFKPECDIYGETEERQGMIKYAKKGE